jgi:hypothetical protein
VTPGKLHNVYDRGEGSLSDTREATSGKAFIAKRGRVI